MVQGLDFCPRSQRPRKVNVVNLVQGLGGPLEDCSYSRLRENENVGSLLPGRKKGTRVEWMSDDDAMPPGPAQTKK